MVNLSLSFTAVFIVTCVLLGFDFHTAFLILLCVFMIIIDMFGVMYLWHIELNAISVVNIIMVGFENILKKKITKFLMFF
jgi:Niemann-Pick C1 protein